MHMSAHSADAESMDAESVDATESGRDTPDMRRKTPSPYPAKGTPPGQSPPDVDLPEFNVGDEVTVITAFEDNDLNEIPVGITGRVVQGWTKNVLRVQLEGYTDSTNVYLTDIHCLER